jgi:Fe-S-cluster containining protein
MNAPTLNPVESAHAWVDRCLASAFAKSAAQGRPVTCRAGCFHCCREPVWVEISEARHIAAQFTGDARAQLASRVAVWWRQFFAGGHDADVPPREQHGAELAQYLSENIWCPLLQDGLCSAYAARPMGCRMFNAVGSPSRCADPAKRITQKFLAINETPEIMLRAMGELCQHAGTALFQFDHLGIWLGHILLGKTERSQSGENMVLTSKPNA